MELVVAGRGTERLALGASPEQVRAGLGAPPKIIEHLPLSYLYVYPDLGIEVDFVVPHGRADVLFFFGDWAGHRAAAVHAERGIGFGASRDEIVAAWGEPAGSDEPHALERRFHTGWLYYRQGIQFHLDERNRLVIVAVMRPAQAPKS
ncbi:MAG TPA: hypothetical protein VE996_03290 [Terriglobales bacterium]|nr:hypothetical protein [Terriglobales bacterium]